MQENAGESKYEVKELGATGECAGSEAGAENARRERCRGVYFIGVYANG